MCPTKLWRTYQRAFIEGRAADSPDSKRCLTKRYDATTKNANSDTPSSWNGNSGIPPLLLDDVVAVVVGVVVTVGVVDVVVVVGVV